MKSLLLVPLSLLAFGASASAQQPQKHDDVILRRPPCFFCSIQPHPSTADHQVAPMPTFGPKDYADVLVPPPQPAFHPQHPELP